MSSNKSMRLTLNTSSYKLHTEYLHNWYNLWKFIVGVLDNYPFVPTGFNITFSVKDKPINNGSLVGCSIHGNGVTIYANCGNTPHRTLLPAYLIWLVDKIDEIYQINYIDIPNAESLFKELEAVMNSESPTFPQIEKILQQFLDVIQNYIDTSI